MTPLDYILIALGALLLVLVAVIVIRTLTFRPKAAPEVDDTPVVYDRERIISNLQALVRCRTVSSYNPENEDDEEFEKLISILPELYPNVYEKCTLTRFEGRGLLYKWEGKEHDGPAVMMAHYDVVPVNEENWEHPPFSAELIDDVIWGRGTLDTKVTFGSILFAADHLIAEGYVPRRDIYFAFSGGEEVSGVGAERIVDYFEANGIQPSLVLDEGGAVVENVFPGVKAPCALIGIAEKGLINLEYKVKSNGGHASAPKPHTPVGVLSEACYKMERHPFPSHMTTPVAEMFDTLGRHSSFLFKMIFANMWAFGWVIDLICKSGGGELNALMRTTSAFTQMEGSTAPNVIPPDARMVANMRLNPKDTVDSAVEYIRGVIKNPEIELNILDSDNPSRISDPHTEGFSAVARAIVSTWRGSIVSPYLMMQCSDSRHWGRISDKVYRFSAMDLTSEERKTIHGNNERIRVACLERATEFYIRLMKEC